MKIIIISVFFCLFLCFFFLYLYLLIKPFKIFVKYSVFLLWPALDCVLVSRAYCRQKNMFQTEWHHLNEEAVVECIRSKKSRKVFFFFFLNHVKCLNSSFRSTQFPCSTVSREINGSWKFNGPCLFFFLLSFTVTEQYIVIKTFPRIRCGTNISKYAAYLIQFKFHSIYPYSTNSQQQSAQGTWQRK